MDLFLKLKKKILSRSDEEDESLILPIDQRCRRFSPREIKRFTDNFSAAFVVGRGGFGTVYKAQIDGSSNFVAIKRYSSNSSQGYQEFRAEAVILSELRHCNIVSLIGYCKEGSDMALVYEYMPHGTLADHLHRGDGPLTWLQRLRICIGAARGLDYLHTGAGTQHGIVHRDVKTTNILLDANFEAKFTDFGLAKVVPINQRNILLHDNFADEISDFKLAEVCLTSQMTDTFVTTNVVGTMGYLDPFYAIQGILTTKSDVYSFGVVLLEVLCGRSAIDRSLDEGLVRWAQDKIKQGKVSKIIDYRLRGQISAKCMNGFAQVASRCLHDDPHERPTMGDILYKLQVILSLQERSSSVPYSSDDESNSLTYGSEREPSRVESDHSSLRFRPEGEPSKVESNPISLIFSSEGEQSKVESNPSSLTFGIEADPSNVESNPGSSTFGIKDELSNEESSPRSLTFVSQTPSSAQQAIILSEGILNPFSYDVLKSATRDFRADSILGKDSHGLVYRGWIDELSLAVANPGGGIAVSIKRLKGLSLYHSEKWLAEIDKLGKLNHPNLVKLIGYCLEDGQRLVVYEFMPGGSLEHHLFNRGSQSVLISWNHRIKVILDAAKGLAYVHNQIPQVALGHFQSSNILFDSNHDARILNLCVDPEVTEGHVSTIFDPESLQYNAPEYIFTGRITQKGQIYGFGKVLLEILTGMPYIDKNRPRDVVCLLDFAMPYLTGKQEISEIIDLRLHGEYSPAVAMRAAKLVMKCFSERPFDRPTAGQLVKELEELQDLQKVAKSNEGNKNQNVM